MRAAPYFSANERALLQFLHGRLQLGLRVHDDRSVPGDRLPDWLAADQQLHHEQAGSAYQVCRALGVEPTELQVASSGCG